VVTLTQVAAALRLASVQSNSAWHKQEDGQSILRSKRSRNRKVAGPQVPIRRIVRSSVWLCVYTKHLGSDLDGLLQNLLLVICTKLFLAMLSVRPDERSVVYYIQDLTPHTLVEYIHHQKRKLKHIVFTNASICVMYASPIFLKKTQTIKNHREKTFWKKNGACPFLKFFHMLKINESPYQIR
jgi:hypothetical protein